MKKHISDHHRRNLELLHQSYLHTAIMFSSTAFMTVILGGIAALQISGIIGGIMLLGTIFIALILIFIASRWLKNAEKIMEALGVEETVMKYLESKKKASAK